MTMKGEEITRQAVGRLSELLGIHEEMADVRYDSEAANDSGFDALYTSGSHTFAIESKSSSVLGQIVPAIETLKLAIAQSPRMLVPLVVVPYMSRSGREHCERAGMGWFDLSGNAKIVAPGLYVSSIGHRNKFQRPGRVESAFGAKGSRVARRLLMEPGVTRRQRQIAHETGLDESYVSRVVRKLRALDLVKITPKGVRVGDADRMLESWRDEYRFDRHRVLKGHITAPVSEPVVENIGSVLTRHAVRHALTGLAGAWAYTHFASHRLSTVYVDVEPTDEMLADLGFRGESRGANTWLVLPNDEGVFDGSHIVGGNWCAHPVQVYLDLKSQPERSAEAAEELRRRTLSWGDDGD